MARLPSSVSRESGARTTGRPTTSAGCGRPSARRSDGRIPALDLVLLGLGPDAHTASLFPGDAALGERERLAVWVDTPGMAPFVSRVTLTLPVMNAARSVLFLVSGEDKAEAVARAFSGAADPTAPASLVRPDSGTLTLLLDPPAARLLEERS